jgi:tyrosyl-tRNA synthetase
MQILASSIIKLNECIFGAMAIKRNFVEELRWRGMLHDMMPGTEEKLNAGMVSGYIGFDPTADSLHVGSLAQIMTLIHFQQCGHKPYALVGGATGMVGDPSGKSAERNLLSEDILQHNLNGIKAQLERFLDFDCGANSAQMVNNYDWFKNISFLDFIRDVGKHITINYMMAKDSVQNRMETGMSFTEFSYQLVQGYDFYYLNQQENCSIQMGGSDQWGNIVTGTELIRRKAQGEAFALTTQLIKKADGTKFGKSEGGNIWLDRNKTSPYQFYQFWLNASDEDAENWIKIFTLKTRQEIETIIEEHKQAPHLRVLQKALAEDVTTRVHSKQDLDEAIQASEVLFGSGDISEIKALNSALFLSALQGVPQYEVKASEWKSGINIVDVLASNTDILPSKSEARKMLKANAISINKTKVSDEQLASNALELIHNNCVLVQKGKKNYYLIKVV